VKGVGGNPLATNGSIWFTNHGRNDSDQTTAFLGQGDDGAVFQSVIGNGSCSQPRSTDQWYSELVGVVSMVSAHDSTTYAAAVAGFADWLQGELWVNWINPAGIPDYHLSANNLCEGCWICGRSRGDSGGTRLTYNSSTGELSIWNTNYCFAAESGNTGWPVLYTCNGRIDQKWSVDNPMIRNLGNGLCLIDNGDWPHFGSCDSSNCVSQWLFNGQY